MYAAIKKKGYVRIITNLGPLSVELHCDQVRAADSGRLGWVWVRVRRKERRTALALNP